MKKPARNRSNKDAGASSDADLEALLGLDDLQKLREMFAAHAGSQVEDVEGLLGRLLAEAKSGRPGGRDDRHLTDLSEALNETRLEANGGDPRARQTLARVRSAVDKAAERGEIHPGYLIIFGRTFAAAGLDVGEPARAAMARAIMSGGVASGDAAYQAFLKPLVGRTDAGEFELYEEADRLTSIFPTDFKTALVESLVRDERPLARRGALGFLLNRDERLALAAIAALGAAAAKGALDPEIRNRVETIRPWLSPARKLAIETSFGPAPTAPETNEPSTKGARHFASVCDGSGASALFATIGRGKGYAIASIMAKSSGVVETLVYDGLGREEMTSIEKALRSATPTEPVLPATFERLMRLALGRNLQSGAPPPFPLVRTFEALGLGPLEPDLSGPAEILSALMAAIPERDDPKAIARAHERIADSEFGNNWFEAGDEVDAALTGADLAKAGAQALLETYFPRRRGFWATTCALSALALRDSAKPRDPTWRQLALVGRDISGGAPLAGIPLMRGIAAASAEAAFALR